MSDLFFNTLSEADTDFDGFYDGKQELVPDGTVFDVVVVDAFNGQEEGTAVQKCFVSVQVVQPGPYLGYKYRYNAKVYDVDATKRDRAMKNLQLLDVQAGSPLSKGKLPLTTENMHEHWVGAAFAKMKIGFIAADPNDPTSKDINFIQGFGYLREKLPQQTAQQQATQQTAQQPSQQAAQQPAPEDDVGF
jgi:hypothetical protein